MRLEEIILKNQKQGRINANKQLIRLKLKELVFTYPNEVTQVLQKTDIHIENDLPVKVLLAILIKHIDTNITMRDAIAKMLLEMDGFYNVVGWIAIAGGALTAVNSILSGIKQGKEDAKQEQEIERERQEQERLKQEKSDKKNRNGWLIFGGVIVLIAIVILYIRITKGKEKVRSKITST